MTFVVNPSRYRVGVAACYVVGAVLCGALYQGLKPPAPAFKINLSRGKMTVKAAPAGAPVSPSAQLPPATPHILPLKTDKAAREKSTIKNAVPREIPAMAPPPSAVAAPTEQVLPTLEQPSVAGASASREPVTLPSVVAAGAPPMPGAEPVPGTFALAAIEKPGGDVLVLGLLVNDQGVVEDVVLVVPSRYSLGDIGLALGYRGQKWQQIEPPMAPGEKRWMEIRIDHGGRNPAKDSIIP